MRTYIPLRNRFSAVGTIVIAAVVIAAQLTLATVPALAANPKALILGSTTIDQGDGQSLEQIQAQAAGFDVTVVTDSQWSEMTATDFAQYQVLILGDPACTGDPSVYQAAIDNAGVWQPVVLSSGGSRVLVGTDPVYHYFNGSAGDVLERNGIALAGAKAGATGLFWALSCTGTALQGALAGLTATDTSFVMSSGAGDEVHIIASSAALTGLTDDTLSNWGSSVHEGFTTIPSDFVPLALVSDSFETATYCGTDIDTNAEACGIPYIVVAGEGIRASSSTVSLSPDQTVATTGTATVTATITSDGSPVVGRSVTFTVSAGPDTGQTFTDITGSDGTVSFTYSNPTQTEGVDTVAASTQNSAGVTATSTGSVTWQANPALSASAAPASTTYASPVTLSYAGLTSGATGTVTFTSGATALCTATVPTDSSCPSPVGLTPGTYPVTATYSGDASTATSSFTVAKAPTALTTTATPTSVAFGSSAVLSAEGMPSGATGTVTFTGNGRTLCSFDVATATSCATAATLPVDDYAATATYTGNSNYLGSTASLAFAVSRASIANLSASATPTETPYGATTTLSYGGLPADATGTVTFTIGGQLSCSVDVTQATSCASTDQPAPDGYTVSAAYSGDSSYLPASATATFTVTKADTAITAGASPNPVAFGASTTLSYSGLSESATGTVAFTSGARALCTAVVGQETSCASPTDLAAAAYPVRATYSGDSNHNGSTATTSFVVSRAVVETFTIGATPTSATYGTPVTLSFAGLPSTADGNITFTARGQTLCLLTPDDDTSCSAPANLAPGTYAVTATYGGDPNHAPATATTTFTVAKAATDSLTATVSPTVATYGIPDTLSYGGLATDATGTVTFTSGATTLCTATVATELGCAAPATLTPGTYPVTATYSGDANYLGSTAGTTFDVVKADVVIFIAGGPEKTPFGKPEILAFGLFPETATGVVTFSIEGRTACTLTVGQTGSCLAPATLAAGEHTVTSVYSGDRNYNGETVQWAFTVTPPPMRSISATTVSGTAKTVTIALAPGETLFVQNRLAHGTVTVMGARIVFTPAAGFVGTQVISYRIVAADGSIVLGTLSITVTAPALTRVATSAPELASTGTASTGMVVFGLACLLLGAGAMLLGRRRHETG